MPKYQLRDIKGVIPAMVTPFDETEALDERRLRECARFLMERGVNGLYLTGSTGEGFLMSSDERKRVVEVVVDEVAGKLPVIVQVGAIGTKLSADLARHAAAAGADAVSSVPPFYWQFTPDQIYRYYADLTASTDLPMVIYNVGFAGLLGFETIRRLASIEGIAGIKYTAATQFEMMRIKNEIGQEFAVFSGSDEMAISSFSFGADGIIGSFYNLIPEIFLQMRAALANKDDKTAQSLQRVANTIIFFSLARNMIAIIKRGMAWQGADAGYCRRPFGNYLDRESEAALKADFRTLRDSHALHGATFLDNL